MDTDSIIDACCLHPNWLQARDLLIKSFRSALPASVWPEAHSSDQQATGHS